MVLETESDFYKRLAEEAALQRERYYLACGALVRLIHNICPEVYCQRHPEFPEQSCQPCRWESRPPGVYG